MMGNPAMAREVVALPDGKLGTRLAGKLAGTFERLQWQPELGAWNNFVSEFALTIPEGPSEVRVSLLPRGEIVFTRDRLRILDATGECWSELPVDLRGTQPFATRLVMEKDIVEVFVGDRYSLVARIPASSEPLRLSVNPSSAASSIRFANW